MSQNTLIDKPLRMIGLTRKSKGEDEGTHADQRAIITKRAEAEGFDLIRVEAERGVSGAKDWRDREMGRAIEDVKAGRADGIIVAYQDRITRERMLAAAEIWTALEDAGAVFVACDGADSRQAGSEMLFAIKAAVARDQWQTYQRRSNDGRKRSVEEHGVHAGDIAPLGYTYTERPDGSTNVKGAAKHGPLCPNDDAERVLAAFEAFANGAPVAEVARILGTASKSAARHVLSNRVYLGEARSGGYVKVGAHPAIVSGKELFNRVQRRLAKGLKGHATVRNERAPLARVLHCETCGGVLTLDRTSGPSYRCKTLGCPRRVSIQSKHIEPVVLEIARGWHAAQHPQYAALSEADASIRPVLEEELAKADKTLAAVEAQADEWDALTYGNARAKAVKARAEALRQVEQAEEGTGWLGLTPERVGEKLEGADAETVRSFVRDQVSVTVHPVGRGKKVPVAERITVLYLTAGKTAGGETVPEVTPYTGGPVGIDRAPALLNPLPPDQLD